MKIVIDTNILISAIITNGFIRDFIIKSGFEFISPAYTLSEIGKYKTEICNKSNLNPNDFSILLHLLLKYVKIVNPIIYFRYLKESKKIIGNIDIKDVPFLACALALDALIWSDDKHFQKQDKIKVLTTKDMIELNK